MKFNIDTVDGGGSVLTKNGVELSLFEACNLLNKLVEKNQDLQFLIIEMLDFIKENDGVTRQEMSDWWNNKVMFMNKLYEENRELKEENEELKQKVSFYKDFQKDARELSKKNERLEQILRIYRKVADCHNCAYHSYDWLDDGDEFEICEKGNNEQQMDYHICEDWREL